MVVVAARRLSPSSSCNGVGRLGTMGRTKAMALRAERADEPAIGWTRRNVAARVRYLLTLKARCQGLDRLDKATDGMPAPAGKERRHAVEAVVRHLYMTVRRPVRESPTAMSATSRGKAGNTAATNVDWHNLTRALKRVGDKVEDADKHERRLQLVKKFQEDHPEVISSDEWMHDSQLMADLEFADVWAFHAAVRAYHVVSGIAEVHHGLSERTHSYDAETLGRLRRIGVKPNPLVVTGEDDTDDGASREAPPSIAQGASASYPDAILSLLEKAVKAEPGFGTSCSMFRGIKAHIAGALRWEDTPRALPPVATGICQVPVCSGCGSHVEYVPGREGEQANQLIKQACLSMLVA